jgi:hypothetical protein
VNQSLSFEALDILKYVIVHMNPKTLVDDLEVARAIGVPVAYVGRLRRARKIPFVQLGHRTIRYDLDAVIRAIGRLQIAEVQ